MHSDARRGRIGKPLGPGPSHLNLTRLSSDELGRRIRAARILRNLEQRDLDDLFEQDGVGRSAGFLERGSPRAPLNRARLDCLVRHLRVPEAWFVERDIDEIIWGSQDHQTSQHLEMVAIRRDLAQILDIVRLAADRDGVESIREAFEQALRQLERGSD